MKNDTERQKDILTKGESPKDKAQATGIVNQIIGQSNLDFLKIGRQLSNNLYSNDKIGFLLNSDFNLTTISIKSVYFQSNWAIF